MMARNRKYQSAAVRFGPAFNAFLICLFIGGSAVGYVYQQNQIFQLGGSLKKLERQLDDLRQKNESLTRTLAVLESPRDLDARVKQLSLGLIPTEPEQWVRLKEIEPAPLTARADDRLYAGSSPDATPAN